MSNGKEQDHPALDILAAYAADFLGGEESERMDVHLASCPLCRLEVKRIRRFQSIDSDVELAGKANWQSARFKLERAFAEQVLPAVARRRPPVPEAAGRRFGPGWLAPVAAAAAVFLIFVYMERNAIPVTSPVSRFGPMRGGPSNEYGITLEAPLGELEGAPALFTWRSERENEFYALEIFTADLEPLHRVDRISGLSWSIPDSVSSVFEPDSIFLWNVQGFKGLESEVSSPNGWFTYPVE